MAASTTSASSAHLTILRPHKPPPFPHSSHGLPHSFSCFVPTTSTSTSTLSISVSASHSLAPLFPIPLSSSRPRMRQRALVVSEEEETAVAAASDEDEVGSVDSDGSIPTDSSEEVRAPARPCELYVCNLPRSCDIPQLLDVFKPFGTVLSVEVSRDPETGISRGCGFVTMSSIPEAKAAIAALDGSDFCGREICVKFSVEMVSGRRNTEALNTAPKRDMVFESPHKVYVGNLAWSVRPEDLREHFGQFGTVVSTRVLHDRKGGRNRVYGFLSFSSADELKAAIETSGSVFHGRILLVREVVNRE